MRQGQGVTKAKGERQLEPRHVGPGTGKVMPQMPGYLAHHVTPMMNLLKGSNTTAKLRAARVITHTHRHMVSVNQEVSVE